MVLPEEMKVVVARRLGAGMSSRAALVERCSGYHRTAEGQLGGKGRLCVLLMRQIDLRGSAIYTVFLSLAVCPEEV